MSYKAVIGIGFGDEGKGITTDYLCSQSNNPFVVRFSGGQQAGHTVVLDGIRHVFSNFGSGILRGAPTYWSKHCTVDPIGIINELAKLKENGINPILFIDEKCPVTTTYDVIHNQNLNKFNQHGSCGVGVGATIDREEKHYSLHFGDLFYSPVLKLKLEAIQKYYGFENIDLDYFFECVDKIIDSKNITPINNPLLKIPHPENLIFEGSQGLLLDPEIGFFPHVTRTSVGTKNILDMGFKPELFLITRAYQTRHGNGSMVGEEIPNNIFVDLDETNVTNYQGVFRRALLNLDLLKYAINKDEYINRCLKNCKSLVITCLDHVRDEHRFTYQNSIVCSSTEDEFIEKISNILDIKNVYISHSNESKNIVKWKKGN